MLKHIYSTGYYFFPVYFGAGITGSAVSGAIGGAGFAITTSTQLGHTAKPVVNSAFGVTAGVAGKLVEQLLDRKPGIDMSEVLEAGALGFIPTKIKG